MDHFARRCGPLRATCLLLSCVAVIHLCAQPVLQLEGESTGANIIVRGTLDDMQAQEFAFEAIWRGVPGAVAVFQFRPVTAPREDVRLMLDRLMEAGLGAYLDTRIRFTKEGVEAGLSAADMAREMDAMVIAACEEFAVESAFSGFSKPTREQLDRLLRIDWSKAKSGVDGSGDQDKYLAIYRYVRAQREELERQMRADLLPLATVRVLGPKDALPGAEVRINSTCGTVFDEENFLCALDLQLADTGGGGIDPALGQAFLSAVKERPDPPADTPVAEPQRIRKRDRWLKGELDNINTRIDRMDQRKEIWELRDRLDDIEDRLTGLGLEVQELREQPRTATDNPLANLSDLTRSNLTIRFARNSVALDPEYRILLNEVFEQLARAAEHKVLITGYTDRSGDPAINLRLSEQRAQAVRNYLLQRGIAPERLLVNHYGDSRSMGRNPEERRVEVEWLR